MSDVMSLGGKVWRLPASLGGAEEEGEDPLIERLLTMRGVSEGERESIVYPTCRSLMKEPFELLHMEEAVARLEQVVRKRERILLYGDYDVDGISCVALAVSYFRALGVEVSFYIPSRISQGYGLRGEVLEDFRKKRGVALCLAMDCGSTDRVAVRMAMACGMEVIVCDHHYCSKSALASCLVVNPNQEGDESALDHLAAAGVVFLLLVALNRKLREGGFKNLPDLLQRLDLVAMATVCDMVPMRGMNRAYVAQGLELLNRGLGNKGLQVLAGDRPITEESMAFFMGPVLNASGRLGKPMEGLNFLLTTDDSERFLWSQKLKETNTKRKQLQQEGTEKALACLQHTPVLVVAADIHPGVTGLVAQQLMRCYHRPAVVIAAKGEGDTAQEGDKGSGRSIRGFHLGEALNEAQEQGLIRTAGGHAMAAGLTTKTGTIGVLRDFLSARFTQPPASPNLIDAPLDLIQLTPSLWQLIRSLAPYGQKFPEPLFLFSSVTVTHIKPFGEQHLFLSLEKDNTKVGAVAFSVNTTPWGEALATAVGEKLTLIGQLRLDYRGAITIKIVDGLPLPAPCL